MKSPAKKDKTSDPRLQDFWQILPWSALSTIFKPKRAIAIVSYADDEGVQLNRGRAGASEGAERIRNYLGRMVFLPAATPPIYVLDHKFAEPRLADRHQSAFEIVRQLLQRGFRVVTLGGGHDYGFPDSAAFFETQRGKILNIDAHLDLRPVVDEKFNSGTGFFRFVEKYGGKNLIEWGIQKQTNASSHLAYAKSKGVKIFDWQSKLPRLSGKMGLSICLDAFAGIRGVSAPAFVGLHPHDGLEAIQTYATRSPWLGIYECAPRYDPLNEDSARLGAIFAYHFIHASAK